MRKESGLGLPEQLFGIYPADVLQPVTYTDSDSEFLVLPRLGSHAHHKMVLTAEH